MVDIGVWDTRHKQRTLLEPDRDQGADIIIRK